MMNQNFNKNAFKIFYIVIFAFSHRHFFIVLIAVTSTENNPRRSIAGRTTKLWRER